jgi:hypothetical protein
MATKTTITPGPTPATTVLAAPYGAEGPLIAGTSQTPNPVDTLAAKSFTINEYNRSFYLNTRLRATAVGFSDTFFEGLVTAWDGQVVTILPDLAHNPSPTIYSNWNINVAGQPGIQGIDGPVGPEGPSGGPVGPQGPPGAPGSVWRNGTGVPLNSLGADGDYYLDDATGDVYMRAASMYSIVANIEGADGVTGPVGPVGPQGPQGIIPEAPMDGGYYARRNGAWDSPPGGGNVSAAGTPTAGQLAQWTSPNTITGYTLDADLTSLSEATGLNTIYYRSAVDTWSPVTIGANLTFNGGTLDAGAATHFTASSTVPVAPVVGDLWYDLSTGNLAIYLYDGTTYQWVLISPVPAVLGTSAINFPPSPSAGQTYAYGGVTYKYTSEGIWAVIPATLLITGYTGTATNAGTITGANQSYNPTPGVNIQNLQVATLDGAALTGSFTFLPPTGDTTVVVDVVNGGTGDVAASLVTSGYTKVAGDTWSPTNGNVYRFFASRIGARSLLQIQGMQ